MTEKIDFTRINNDINGNPRYVCHYLSFMTEKDRDLPYDQKYPLALKRAKKLGGRKFHNKQYGGGIVFSTYNIYALENKIQALVNEL